MPLTRIARRLTQKRKRESDPGAFFKRQISKADRLALKDKQAEEKLKQQAEKLAEKAQKELVRSSQTPRACCLALGVARGHGLGTYIMSGGANIGFAHAHTGEARERG